MTRGKFITLEGGEGVGKTTNLAFIKSYLLQHGIDAVVTREPGGTELAEKIRQLLLDKNSEAMSEQAELLLMFAARSQHIKHIIEPALSKGLWVLSDRFTDATYAYQGGGRAMQQDTIEYLENLVQGSLRPDMTLLLDAPVETGARRASQRGGLDRFEEENLNFFSRVRENYLGRAKRYPERIKLINADQTLPQVQNDIAAALNALLT